MPGWINILAVILALGAAIVATIWRKWKLTLLALAAQYVGMSLQLASVLSLDTVIIKLLVGLMCCAVLWISCNAISYQDLDKEKNLFSSNLFRILATLLMIILTIVLSPALQLLPIDLVPSSMLISSLLLLLLGLLQLGISNDPFFTIAGLLTFYLGFDTFYSVVEVSSLLVGLLAIINMAIVLLGAYLLIKDQPEELV